MGADVLMNFPAQLTWTESDDVTKSTSFVPPAEVCSLICKEKGHILTEGQQTKVTERTGNESFDNSAFADDTVGLLVVIHFKKIVSDLRGQNLTF